MESVQAPELVRLDRLLQELGSETEAQCELLREHLKSARVSLVALMPAEYALSLQMAGEALNSISDPGLRARVRDFIQCQ